MQNMFYRNNIVICVAFMLLAACSEQGQEANSNLCLNQAHQCQSDDFDKAFLRLEQPLQIEHPITISLQLPGDWKVGSINARLQGANMQMGRIPVEFQSTTLPGLYQGSLFIVGCTQPDMVWQLQVEVESTHPQQLHLLQWTFSTEHME